MTHLMKLHIDNLAREKQPVNVMQNATGASLYIYDVISSDYGVGAGQIIDAIAQVGDAKTHRFALCQRCNVNCIGLQRSTHESRRAVYGA